jgi:hypothetical protein
MIDGRTISAPLASGLRGRRPHLYPMLSFRCWIACLCAMRDAGKYNVYISDRARRA